MHEEERIIEARALRPHRLASLQGLEQQREPLGHTPPARGDITERSRHTGWREWVIPLARQHEPAFEQVGGPAEFSLETLEIPKVPERLDQAV